jgi:hypothetical protein
MSLHIIVPRLCVKTFFTLGMANIGSLKVLFPTVGFHCSELRLKVDSERMILQIWDAPPWSRFIGAVRRLHCSSTMEQISVR